LTHFFASATYYPAALLFCSWHVFSFLKYFLTCHLQSLDTHTFCITSLLSYMNHFRVFSWFLIIFKPQSNHNATVATRFICISILSLKLPIVKIISLVYMHIRRIAQYYSPKIHQSQNSNTKSRNTETGLNPCCFLLFPSHLTWANLVWASKHSKVKSEEGNISDLLNELEKRNRREKLSKSEKNQIVFFLCAYSYISFNYLLDYI